MVNLWNDLDNLKSDDSSPIHIIEEQGEYLKEGTKDDLKLDITEFDKLATPTRKALESAGIASNFCYRVDLVSNYLENYSYRLFNIYYDIRFFPCIFNVPGNSAEEWKEDFERLDIESNNLYYRINDMQDLEDILERIFNSSATRTVMKNIKSLVQENDMDE